MSRKCSMADLFGPPPLDQWPVDLLALFHERWAIREFCGGQPEDLARREAMAEIWGNRNIPVTVITRN